MRQQFQFAHRIVLYSIVVAALLIAPAFNAQAKGKGFKDLVKHFETTYRARKTRIPLLGLANFAVKVIRPAGVKSFKLAVFENQDFNPRAGVEPFEAMRDAYGNDWQPLVQVTSKRGGYNHVMIYSRCEGKDVQFALLSLEEHEAVVLEVRFNPDAAVRFLDNPKIMGISLGNSIRGKGTNNGNSGNGNAVTTDKPAAVASSPSDLSVAPVAPVAPETDKASDKKEVETQPVEARVDSPDRNAIRIETRLVNLNVKAMDRGGRPLIDLKPEDFEVFEDGVRQQVSHFRPVNAPVNLIMLLDLSGSTKKKRAGMRNAAEKFIEALPPQDRVAIVAFTGKYHPLTDFTDDKAKLKSVLKEIRKISGDTAFYDSLWKALNQLERLSDARKAIIVLTDGEDDSLENSEHKPEHQFEQLLERAAEEDVTIYPIYFSTSNNYDKVALIFGGGSLMGSEKSKTARRQLTDLAEQTGGEIFDAQREEDLGEAYKRVAAELHTLYSLAYSPDRFNHNGEFRKVSVKVNRAGSVARTRRGYYDR